jgi:hypothetical protein
LAGSAVYPGVGLMAGTSDVTIESSWWTVFILPVFLFLIYFPSNDYSGGATCIHHLTIVVFYVVLLGDGTSKKQGDGWIREMKNSAGRRLSSVGRSRGRT